MIGPLPEVLLRIAWSSSACVFGASQGRIRTSFPRRVLCSYQTPFQAASLKITSHHLRPTGGLWLDRGPGLTEAADWLRIDRVRCQFLVVYRPCAFPLRDRGLSSDEPQMRTGQNHGLFADSADAPPASRKDWILHGKLRGHCTANDVDDSTDAASAIARLTNLT
jgi:hypothetical protein